MLGRVQSSILVDEVNDSPPPYEELKGPHASKWNPKAWRKRTWSLVVGAVIVIILVAVLAGVFGARSSAYPSYTALSYQLQDTYSGSDFFDNFDFFTGYDPASGFVHYVPEVTANSTQFNLTSATDSSAIMRVDTSSGIYDTGTGRYSVRLTSKKQYDSGLFVFDVVNSPYGCSTWPALWLSDPSNWPKNGEIDVVEAVNQGNTGNQMTLHTSSGCKMNVKRKQTGNTLQKDCWNSTNDNAGCGVKGPTYTYGQEFNQNGGGTYAMEWRSDGIRVWFFARGSEPNDLPSDVNNSTAPDPSSWSEPLADFPKTHCDINTHFKNMSIIADIDLCGSWAGSTAVYSTEDACPGTCSNFVANNASAFDTAYWEFRSFRVYTATSAQR